MGKLKIPPTPPTTNKAVEAEIRGKDCTFSAFVIAAVREALEELKADRAESLQDLRGSPKVCTRRSCLILFHSRGQPQEIVLSQ